MSGFSIIPQTVYVFDKEYHMHFYINQWSLRYHIHVSFFFIVLQILQKLSKSVNFLIAQVIFAIL